MTATIKPYGQPQHSCQHQSFCFSHSRAINAAPVAKRQATKHQPTDDAHVAKASSHASSLTPSLRGTASLSETSALAQTTDGAASLRRLRRRENPRTASNGLVAARAIPDSDGLPLDLILAAEGAVVLRVLRDLHLLHDFPERRTIARAVLAGDAHLLRALVNLRGAADREGREPCASARIRSRIERHGAELPPHHFSRPRGSGPEVRRTPSSDRERARKSAWHAEARGASQAGLSPPLAGLLAPTESSKSDARCAPRG